MREPVTTFTRPEVLDELVAHIRRGGKRGPIVKTIHLHRDFPTEQRPAFRLCPRMRELVRHLRTTTQLN